MGKKKSMQSMMSPMKMEIKDEITDNEVSVARDRLKGALKELMHHTDSGSSADSSEENAQEFNKSAKKSDSARKNVVQRRMKRRRQVQPDTPFHHTYVMKLFDRSVDLAQFQEDTPLYPICRAWMANQPRNPAIATKVRSPSPEIINEIPTDDSILDSNGDVRDIYSLPPPLPSEEPLPKNRIPSPIPVETEKLNLNYEGQQLKTREQLLNEHREHWIATRKKWHQQAHKNEKRYAAGAERLNIIFKRAQTDYE